MASPGSAEPLYLGLDLSTQQLKAIVINSSLTVVSRAKVDFDADFGSKYSITNGVVSSQETHEVYAPVAMWLEAVDLVLARLRDGECPLHHVRAISGAGQQHGSVYWGPSAAAALGSLDPDRDLVEQLGGVGDDVGSPTGALARPWAPNWQDSSTQAECDAFEECVGGKENLARITGSSAHHRFTGPQIMRLRRLYPNMYAATSRISLVSSFLASVFLGAIAPIDIGDVCGMNLWDIAAASWSAPLLGLCAGDAPGAADSLRAKLGDVRLDGGGSMGSVAHYFAARYGFPTDCRVAPFTGDNPATILALPLRSGDAVVSLGTSTTFLLNTGRYRPDPSYHFMEHPTTRGQYMFMLCYKNGGLAREKVRDALGEEKNTDSMDSDGDPWAAFNRAVRETAPLGMVRDDDRARLGLYFYRHEIVPNVPAGTWRYTCAPDGSDLRPAPASSSSSEPASAPPPWPPVADARAIVESQALSMRLRSQPLLDNPPGTDLSPQPRRVYLAGGGSVNPAVARTVGDVLGGAEGIFRIGARGDACALGAAHKACWATERADGQSFDSFVGARWSEQDAAERLGEGYVADGTWEKYGRVLTAFGDMERQVLEKDGR